MNGAPIGLNAVKDLGLLTAVSNFTEQQSVLPGESYYYTFQVGDNEKLYPQFDLYGFDDDLDLGLSQWNSTTSTWEELTVSESGGNDPEWIFKVLNSGDYMLQV